MNKQEAKKYILQHWSVSSGKRITKMLRHYWKMNIKTMEELKKPAPDVDIVKVAERIFNG